MRSGGISFVIVLFSFVFAFGSTDITSVHAQFGLSTTDNASLTFEPKHPGPNSFITIKLDAYTMNTTGSTIRWFIDGDEVVESRNARSLRTETGDIGETKTVRVLVSGEGSRGFSLIETITPMELDLVVEAETHVPAFYSGRPLPTPGSQVRIVAIPHTSNNYNPEDLSYQWQRDTTVLFGGPVTGKRSALLTVPELEDPVISVTVYTPSGRELAQRSLLLTGIDPEVHFYRENPLRSTNRRAISETLMLTSEEVTVRAEPYFVDRGALQGSLEYIWRLDGDEVEPGNSSPQVATFRQTGGSGTARVSFEIVNPFALLQSAQGVFNIFFEGDVTNN